MNAILFASRKIILHYGATHNKLSKQYINGFMDIKTYQSSWILKYPWKVSPSMETGTYVENINSKEARAHVIAYSMVVKAM